MTGSTDAVTVEGLRDAVRRYIDVEDVVNRARAAAQDLLAATIILPYASFAVRDEAHRLVVLAVAGQRALRWGSGEAGEEERRRQNRALRDLLVRGAAVLSPRVSRLLGPGPAREARRAVAELAEPAEPEEGEEAAEPREPREAGSGPALPARLNPLEEGRLRNAVLSELIGIAGDPNVGRVVEPAIDRPPDEAAPRLRRVDEITLRQPRVLLQGAVRERLSDDARMLVDLVAPGQTDLLSIINALDSTSLLAVPAAGALAAAAPNDPTGGFPVGYGALRRPIGGLVRPPGVGELLSVRREHARYIVGPITYIENVLAGETRSRTHRRLDRTEEMTFTETERTVVDERDLQRTERFDLVTETRNEVSSQTQIQVGAQVSGSYGTVQASASFGFTSSSATADATRTATTTARETVDRALNRITERTLERRQRITIREVEETNKHDLANSPNEPNRAGIYRFVDDEQTVGVYSYGLRLMIEAHVPEPGAYLRWATASSGDAGNDPEPPKPSVPGGAELTSPAEINTSNYLSVAGPYGAVVEPPPPLLRTVGMADRQEFQQNTPQPTTPAFLFYRSYERLQAPDGYEAISASGVIYASAWMPDVYVAVDSTPLRGVGQEAMPYQFLTPLANKTGVVPIAMTINNAWGFAFTVELICQRSSRFFEQWQVRTFNAIMQAYNDRHSAWEERQRAGSISTAGVVTGTNPAINRQVERGELKKGVISLLAGSPLQTFGAITQAEPTVEPIIDAAAAVGQSAIISFYEQAFEWENTIYTLYPYFWGRHSSWADSFGENGADTLHDAFLRAGLARVVVPVRPGFEAVALWFLATGQVWYGGSPAPISNTDPLYRSIAAELLAIDEAARGGVLQGATWTAVTPTNLVYLQGDAELNPPPA